MSLTPEALARQQIDAQLVAAGWIIQDYNAVEFDGITTEHYRDV